MKPPSEAPSIPRASRAQGHSRPSSKPLLDCAANTLCEWGLGNYMPPNERLNGGKLDLVIFADQFTLGVSSKRPKAIGTMRRLMILNGIGRFAQFTRMAFVSGLGAAGLGLLAPLFSIRRWRFGRRARSLVRTLKPKHQLDQIVLAQPLQIIAIHPNLESATRPTRKGWVITSV